MFTYVIAGAVAYGLFTFRRGIAATTLVMWKSSKYTKMVMVIFLLGIMPLIFPKALPAHLVSFAYAYALLTIVYQLYRIWQVGRKAKCYLPRATYGMPLCVAMVMATPVWDLFLERSYPAQTSILVGAATVSYACLYLIEVHIRYPHLWNPKWHPLEGMLDEIDEQLPLG